PNDSRDSASKHFMFTMKPDVPPEPELHVPSDDEDDLDPYAGLVGAHATTSSSSSVSRGPFSANIEDAGKASRGKRRIDTGVDDSPIRQPIQRSQSSVEDFSYLFPSHDRKNPLPTTKGDKAPIHRANPALTKRRNKFVSTSDSSDEAQPGEVSPKK